MTSDFDRLVASADPAMLVVTVRAGTERDGCLVGFHSQTSIDPLRYCVWMSTANRTTRLVRDADRLAVHLLGADQHDLAATFGELSGDETDKFRGIRVIGDPRGTPVLAGCPAVMILRIVAVHDVGGDHLCVIGEPVDVTATDRAEPLRFTAVGDLVAGHDA